MGHRGQGQPDPAPNQRARLARGTKKNDAPLLNTLESLCAKAGQSCDRRNAARLGLSERGAFVCRSWVDGDFVRETGTGFDMIVSNPPYIPTADIASLEPEVREHDPLSALDGGADGFAHYEKIASLAPLLLKKGGYILLEAGIGQARHISEVFAGPGLGALEIRPDLAGTERWGILKKRN